VIVHTIEQFVLDPGGDSGHNYDSG